MMSTAKSYGFPLLQRPQQKTINKFANTAIFSAFLLLTGAAMQGYANNTFDSFAVALFLFVIGIIVAASIFRGKHTFELQSFVLSYSICIFVGGLSQCYSMIVFNVVQTTTDSVGAFFPRIASHPPFTTLADIPQQFNSRLAPVIWQQVYKVTWLLNLDFGVYTGVMFNAFIVGLTCSITTRIARELYGNDSRRLQRTGAITALCGLLILFGSILLRDCFTTFLNTLVLWVLVKWIIHPNNRNLFYAIITIIISAFVMSFLRRQAVLLFGVFCIMAFLFWMLSKKINIVRIIIVFSVLGIVTIASPYLLTYMDNLKETQTKGLESYAEGASARQSDNSLGMRLILNQPLPIRLILGSGNLLISPIPLWINFRNKALEYHLIKGYNGIYQVLIIPLIIAGYFIAITMFRTNPRQAIPFMFIGVYFLTNLVAVVATSMEQRHIAQYMPACILLAALPDTRDKKTKKMLHRIMTGWFSIVACVHLAWALMKYS